MNEIGTFKSIKIQLISSNHEIELKVLHINIKYHYLLMVYII